MTDVDKIKKYTNLQVNTNLTLEEIKNWRKKYESSEPEYITPVREGNKAFPVFEGLTGSKKKDDLLDKNVNNNCEIIQSNSETLIESPQTVEKEINEILMDNDIPYQKIKKI